MKALFSQTGTLLQLDTSGALIVQGSVNANTVLCAFQNISNLSGYTATITFRRSDAQVSPEMIMTANQSVVISEGAYAGTYNGFGFLLYDEWFLTKSGMLEMTVKLYSGQVIKAFGKITVAVQPSIIDEYADISVEQYNNLIQEINAIKTRLDALEGE